MKKIVTLSLILVFILALFAFASDEMKYEIGKKVTEITLKDHDGMDFDLEKTLAREDVKGVVFCFVSEQCPVSKSCESRYFAMTDQFKKDGILFIGINPNRTESIAIMKERMVSQNFNFPVLKDWNNVIADRFGALFTPQVYLVGKDGTLLYRGRIDDNHRNPELVKETTLINAVAQYIAGEEITVKETLSNGCDIKRVPKK